MQLFDICQVLVNFSISFLFGKQFWASLHLLSESGWNWCPWQALVSFRFPIPMHCIIMSLSFLCKVGGFLQSRVALSWTEGSFSHFTLGNWAEHCFSQVPIMYLIFLPWALEIFRLIFEVSWAHDKILELRDMPICANLRFENL